MDLSKFENIEGVYYNDEMVGSRDGIKLNLERQFLSDTPKAILIILHGLANNLGLYDDFVKPFIKARSSRPKNQHHRRRLRYTSSSRMEDHEGIL